SRGRFRVGIDHDHPPALSARGRAPAASRYREEARPGSADLASVCSWPVRRWWLRQGERERAPLPHLTLHPDPSAVQLHQPPRQRETQPGPFRLAGVVVTHLPKRLENLLVMLRRNPHPRIPHRYFHPTPFHSRLHPHHASLRSELHRVRQQIDQHLPHLPLVRHHLPNLTIHPQHYLHSSPPCPLSPH